MTELVVTGVAYLAGKTGKKEVGGENMERGRILLKENERVDDLQRNGYRIIQNKDKFCFGMDAVLLSGFAQVKPGEQVIDLGTYYNETLL